MSVSEELPNPGAEERLGIEQAEAFRDHVLFPAITYLTHGKFDVDSLRPGQGYSLSGTDVDEDDKPCTRYGADSVCWVNRNEQSSHEGELGISVTLSVEQVCDDEVTKACIRGMSPAEYEALIKNIDHKDARAWDIITFTLALDSDGEPISRFQHRELQDDDAQVLWTEQEAEQPKEEDDEVTLSENERALLADLEQDLVICLSEDDLAKIADCLMGLGLPEGILEEYVKAFELVK